MEPQAFFDVEIRISRSYTEGYTVSLRPWYGEEVIEELPPPPKELRDVALDPRRYGVLAYQWLFRGRLADVFWKARGTAGVPAGATFLSSKGGIRLRLWLDGLPPHLTKLPWEALQAPDDYLPLSLCMAFSRFVRVKARPVQSLNERPLRVLQIIANPIDLDAYELPQLDPTLAQLTDRLVSSSYGSLVHVDRLEDSVTLEAIRERVQSGYHVLYAAAHTMVDKDLYVLLTDEAGNAQRVGEDEISRALAAGIPSPPQLVILATPLIHRTEAGSMQAALTPRLLEAGVQGVLASEIAQEHQKLQRFSEVFFRRLVQTGIIDVSVAQARAEIYDTEEWDWSYPVLVMRSRDCQLFQPLDMSVAQQIDIIGKGATMIGAAIESIG